MRTFAHVTGRLYERTRLFILTIVASASMAIFMAQPAHAAVPTVDDCTGADAVMKYFNFAVYSLQNIGKAGGWTLVAIGLLVGVGGSMVSKGNWKFLFGAVGLVFVAFSLIPLLGVGTYNCVPRVTF